MKKIVFISNIIAPYRISFFNELSKCDNIALNVLYVAKNEKNRKWDINKNELKYAYNIIPGIHIPSLFKKNTFHISYNYNFFLNSANPDIIVLGTDLISSSISFGIIRYAKKHNIKLIRYEGQHCYNNQIGSLKLFIYKKLYRYFDGFFVYSELTKKYLIEKFDINNELIKVGYNVGDLSAFSKINYLNESEKIEILFCGSLDERKNILSLLQTMKDNFDFDYINFTIIGDGPLKDKVNIISNTFNKMKIKIMGSIFDEELIKEYNNANIFILPSMYDPASIVITESLSAGLFTIGSKFDGSAVNFIKDKINGIIIDPHNENSIIDALKWSIKYAQNNNFNKTTIKETMDNFQIKDYVNSFASWDLIK